MGSPSCNGLDQLIRSHEPEHELNLDIFISDASHVGRCGNYVFCVQKQLISFFSFADELQYNIAVEYPGEKVFRVCSRSDGTLFALDSSTYCSPFFSFDPLNPKWIKHRDLQGGNLSSAAMTATDSKVLVHGGTTTSSIMTTLHSITIPSHTKGPCSAKWSSVNVRVPLMQHICAGPYFLGGGFYTDSWVPNRTVYHVDDKCKKMTRVVEGCPADRVLSSSQVVLAPDNTIVILTDGNSLLQCDVGRVKWTMLPTPEAGSVLGLCEGVPTVVSHSGSFAIHDGVITSTPSTSRSATGHNLRNSTTRLSASSLGQYTTAVSRNLSPTSLLEIIAKQENDLRNAKFAMGERNATISKLKSLLEICADVIHGAGIASAADTEMDGLEDLSQTVFDERAGAMLKAYIAGGSQAVPVDVMRKIVDGLAGLREGAGLIDMAEKATIGLEQLVVGSGSAFSHV